MPSDGWGVCIGSASSGHLVDASVGFCLAPLMAAALGVLSVGNKLTLPQRGALAVVALWGY